MTDFCLDFFFSFVFQYEFWFQLSFLFCFFSQLVIKSFVWILFIYLFLGLKTNFSIFILLFLFYQLIGIDFCLDFFLLFVFQYEFFFFQLHFYLFIFHLVMSVFFHSLFIFFYVDCYYFVCLSFCQYDFWIKLHSHPTQEGYWLPFHLSYILYTSFNAYQQLYLNAFLSLHRHNWRHYK